ncbi:MAG: phosphoesterase [Betaproteobacteria bacterium]
MQGAVTHLLDARSTAQEIRERFAMAFEEFDRNLPTLIMGHHDVDGLAAMAILIRAFQAAGRAVVSRIVGRAENVWSKAMMDELRDIELGGVIAADLGVRQGSIKTGTPTIVIDHHVPTGIPTAATVITGYGLQPVPTSSLLAYWCSQELADVERWVWIPALGLIGDMADRDGFLELAVARERYGITTLREATSLLNAPRRSASGNASAALTLLLKSESPKEIISGQHAETETLLAAREEVKRALDAAKRLPPRIRNSVDLILLDSPCQIHPLIAQSWRGRLRKTIVLAANTGYRPGWIHFSVRSALDIDLVEFLAKHAPAGADENYGSGHPQATGGALSPADWNALITDLGFGSQKQVQV